MAYTQADLDKLKATLTQSVSRLQYGDRSINFRSVDEIRAQIAIVEGELDRQGGRRTRVRRVYVTSGFD